MGHLEAGTSEAALDVKALVGVAAVENALVTANALGNKVEGLDESQAELLALLVLGDGNVFDVADGTEVVDAATPTSVDEQPGQPGTGGAYNLRSTMRAPVATTAARWSSMTMM